MPSDKPTQLLLLPVSLINIAIMLSNCLSNNVYFSYSHKYINNDQLQNAKWIKDDKIKARQKREPGSAPSLQSNCCSEKGDLLY